MEAATQGEEGRGWWWCCCAPAVLDDTEDEAQSPLLTTSSSQQGSEELSASPSGPGGGGCVARLCFFSCSREGLARKRDAVVRITGGGAARAQKSGLSAVGTRSNP